MRLGAFCAGLTLLGLLGNSVIASAADDGEREESVKTAEILELFAACESGYPLLSVRWGDANIDRAAETASAFLDVPSVTPQVIIDKARSAFRR